MNVWVTGGLGYIGSHICKYLKENTNHHVTVIDWNGLEKMVYGDKFLQNDFCNAKNHTTAPDAIIHCAAYTSTTESIQNATKYYDNNVGKSIELIRWASLLEKPPKIIFSSTAAVYGESKYSMAEVDKKAPTNPYGMGKLMVEQVLKDSSNIINSVSFRYFNAAGAARDGTIGIPTYNESVIPLAVRACLNKTVFNIYGDGNAVRDYVHVEDIARAHVLALDFLDKNPGAHIFNLGCDTPVSVLDIVEGIEYLAGERIVTKFVAPRVGDVAFSQAQSYRAHDSLQWYPRNQLVHILEDSINWELYSQGRKI